MADDIDKSLLQRLQALRASSATPERPSPAATPVSVDVIERAKTPTREEALADRLKRLRHRHDDNASAAGPSPAHAGAPPASAAEDKRHVASGAAAIATPLRPADADVVDDETDALFRTDDRTLEELLGDVVDGPPDPAAAREPRDEEVRALLEELSAAIPPDGEEADGPRQARDSDDDSEGERMRGEVDDVVARFQDEAELDAAQGRSRPEDATRQSNSRDGEPQLGEGEEASERQDAAKAQLSPASTVALLPSLPSDLPPLPSTGATPAAARDDIAARIAALRADAAPALPSVPTGAPAAGVPRLTSRTRYTDADVDSWCTVCLDDAALRCLGCDDDPYCARCWREMHRGPAAAFDDRSHRCVQFARRPRGEEDASRIALGAS